MKKNQVLWSILTSMLIIVGIIFPLIQEVYNSIGYRVATNYFNIEAVGPILEETEIKQQLNIPVGAKKYKIMFATYIRNNTGSIKVEIIQGKVKLSEVIDVSKLLDNQFYTLDMDMGKLDSGVAELIIQGIDGQPENSVTICKSQDTSLGSLVVNGEELNGGIIQEFVCYRFNQEVIVKILLILLLFIVLVYVIYNINCTKDNKKEGIRLFWCASICNMLIMSIKAPILTFMVEPYAELVTNFYINATKYTIAENILITDAGYLPLLQRIVAIFVVKILGLSPIASIYILQGFAILFISLVTAMFSLDYYKQYGSKIFRFMVSIILGSGCLIYSYYDSHSFINFTYYGIVWIILTGMLDLNDLKRNTYIFLLGFTALVCISKSYYTILIPIVLFLWLIKYKNITKREKKYYLIIFISCMIQLLYSFGNTNIWITPEKEKIGIIKILNNTFYYIVQQTIDFIYPYIGYLQSRVMLNWTIIMIMSFVLILGIYGTIKLKKDKVLILFETILIVIGTPMLNVITTVWGGNYEWSTGSNAIRTRHTLFIIIGLIFNFIMVIYIIMQILNIEADSIKFQHNESYTILNYKKKVFNIVYFVMAITLTSRFVAFENDELDKKVNSFSDWKIYSRYLNEDKYVLPINPYPFVLQKNAKLYLIGKENNFSLPHYTLAQVIPNEVMQVHEVIIEDMDSEIISIYAKRLREYNGDRIVAILYDNEQNVIEKIIQVNDIERQYVGFIPEDSLKGVYKIAFFTENMQPAYVLPEVMLGVSQV